MREARVDLGAIAHNVDTLARVIGTPHTMVVVKAGGYGHGAVAVARTVLDAGADWLGVVDIREALELRAAGVTAPVAMRSQRRTVSSGCSKTQKTAAAARGRISTCCSDGELQRKRNGGDSVRFPGP